MIIINRNTDTPYNLSERTNHVYDYLIILELYQDNLVFLDLYINLMISNKKELLLSILNEQTLTIIKYLTKARLIKRLNLEGF